MTPPETDDEAWIQATKDGDQEAFASLVRKYQSRLFDLASRILGNPFDAEDIVQDAFLDIYRHLGSFEHRSKFSTWIYTITLNRIRNRLRHNKILKWISLDKTRDNEDGSRVYEWPEPGPSVSAQVESKLDLETTQKAVRELPVLHQSIFILYYFHNLPLEEIAGHLNRPANTVKVYLHRARKLLYKRLRTPVAVTSEAR